MVAEDGALRARSGAGLTTGILAELSPEIDVSLVGDWRQAAVAVAEDMTLIAQRTGKLGELKLTAWCNMEALLPQPQAFWTVA